MPVTKIICFANSRKMHGRCVAGLAWDGATYSKWVRPVSSFEGGALHSERLYAMNAEPQLLDIIELEYKNPKPSGCHVEDVLVDSSKKWKKMGSIRYLDALQFASRPTVPLWVDGVHTTYGRNDSIGAEVAASLRSSLRLIVPDSMTMTATAEGWENKRKVRGKFSLGAVEYILTITDPIIEANFANVAIGYARKIQKPLLCISIGEVFVAQNACYKLIAGVMEA